MDGLDKLIAESKGLPPLPEGCLTDECLLDYAWDVASGDLKGTVVEHLNGCNFCRERAMEIKAEAKTISAAFAKAAAPPAVSAIVASVPAVAPGFEPPTAQGAKIAADSIETDKYHPLPSLPERRKALRNDLKERDKAPVRSTISSFLGWWVRSLVGLTALVAIIVILVGLVFGVGNAPDKGVPAKRPVPRAPDDRKPGPPELEHAVGVARELTILEPASGANLAPGTRVRLRGKISPGFKPGPMYAYLVDAFGGMYLQDPKVEVRGDTFEHTNINIGTNIEAIEIVGVDEAGQKRIQEWREKGRWGRIERDEVASLSGYKLLGYVKIVSAEE